jgi:hypothetical protein
MRIAGATLLCLVFLIPYGSAWSGDEIADASQLARQVMMPEPRRLILAPSGDCGIEFGVSAARSTDKSATTSWPFQLSCKPAAAAPWRLGVSGALHTVQRVPGQPAASGFPDINLNARLGLSDSFTAVLGARMPSGSQVGSTSALQSVTLLHTGPLARNWSYLGQIRLNRSQRPADGIGRVGTILLGRLKLDLASGQSMSFELAGSSRSGTNTVTNFGVSHEKALWNGFTSILSLSYESRRTGSLGSAGITLVHSF